MPTSDTSIHHSIGHSTSAISQRTTSSAESLEQKESFLPSPTSSSPPLPPRDRPPYTAATARIIAVAVTAGRCRRVIVHPCRRHRPNHRRRPEPTHDINPQSQVAGSDSKIAVEHRQDVDVPETEAPLIASCLKEIAPQIMEEAEQLVHDVTQYIKETEMDIINVMERENEKKGEDVERFKTMSSSDVGKLNQRVREQHEACISFFRREIESLKDSLLKDYTPEEKLIKLLPTR